MHSLRSDAVALIVGFLSAGTLIAGSPPELVEPTGGGAYEAQLAGENVAIPLSKFDMNEPAEVATLLPTPYRKGDSSYFGSAIAVEGDLMVVGSGDDSLGTNSGAVSVFARNEGGTDAWGQIARITAPDGAAGDYFGSSVALSGETLAVGALFDDDKGIDSGSVYIFGRNAGGADAWGQITKITPSDGAAEAHFGGTVAASGDTLVVGASYSGDHGTYSGAAYIFERNVGGLDNWGQVVKLSPADGAERDFFGTAADIDGDTVAIGATFDDDAGDGSGSVYVFERDRGGADAWGQLAKLTASNGASGDRFGSPVSIDGDTLVVGAGLGDGVNPDTGSAYVFERNAAGPDSWGEVAVLAASDGGHIDYFGSGVDISGDRVVVGAGYDDADEYHSGSAYIFDRNQGGVEAWGQVTKITAADGAEGDYFGSEVSIAGDTVFVAATGDDDGGVDSGSVYVFDRNESGPDLWGLVTKKVAPPGMSADGDFFGYAVAGDGETLIVGAPNDDEVAADSGAAYIFRRDEGGGGSWVLVTKVKAADPGESDGFGFSVAVSGDIIVVGAVAADVTGEDSGAAYVFARDEGGVEAWGQVAKLAASDGSASDNFGFSVAVGGTTAVVGSPFTDGSAIDSGSAVIFERDQDGFEAWGEVATVTPSHAADHAWLGYSVAISGTTIVIGAPWDGYEGNDVGSVTVLGRDVGGPGAWGEEAILKTPVWGLGGSLAIDGNTIVAGAPGDSGSVTHGGTAVVFSRTGNTWSQAARLLAPDAQVDDAFGSSVAITGDAVVVGAISDNGAEFDSGSAYVFSRNEGGPDAWGQVAYLTAADGGVSDNLGFSAAVLGDLAFLGAPYRDEKGADSGAVIIFRLGPTIRDPLQRPNDPLE